MHEAILNKKQVLIFRQWSGKNYAIFASLGKEVNIGHVDVEICDKASEKSNQTNSLTLNTSANLIEEIIDQEELDEEKLESQLITLLTITSNVDKSSQHCCNLFTNYFLTFYLILFSGCRYVLFNLK